MAIWIYHWLFNKDPSFDLDNELQGHSYNVTSAVF